MNQPQYRSSNDSPYRTALDASNTSPSSSLNTSIAPSQGVSVRNKSAPLLRRVKHFSSPFFCADTVRAPRSSPWKTTPTGDMLVYASLLMAPRSPAYVQRNGRGVDMSVHYHGNSNEKTIIHVKQCAVRIDCRQNFS